MSKEKMNVYLKTLSKKKLRKIINGLMVQNFALGHDADIMFREEETEQDFEREDGFYCSHSGENLLDFKD